MAEEKQFYTASEVAQMLLGLAKERKHWSGIPLPVEGHELVIEPRSPYYSMRDFYKKPEPEPKPDDELYQKINTWWSTRLQCDIYVYRSQKTGKSRFIPSLHRDRAVLFISTLHASVWPIEAEVRAMEKLTPMLDRPQLESYVTAGCFVETSKRSKVVYVFRKGRPTVALTPEREGECHSVLAALCLHPIGYYHDTFAGVMCPTDDVIAHLLMMRGSEEKFWANAYQHRQDDPASGI